MMILNSTQKNRHPDINSPERNLTLFVMLCIGFGVIAVWSMSQHYQNASALLRWSQLLTVFDTGETRIEHIGLMHPPVPIYLLGPFYWIPGLNNATAPYLLSIMTGASLLTLWNHHLKRRQYEQHFRTLLVLLLASNPLFLWAVTTGSEKSLSLLTYYVFCYALSRLLLQKDTRAVIILASTLVIYFFIDERTFFLLVAFVPLIALVAPKRMLEDSSASIFMIILLPVSIAIASWFYLNWIFHGDAQTFLHAPDSVFLGISLNAIDSPWLIRFGGQWFTPLLIALLAGLLCFPAIVLILRQARRRAYLFQGILVFTLVPVFATDISTANFFLAHPFEILFLLNAAIMAGFFLMPNQQLQKKNILIALLAGNLSTAGLLFWLPSEDLQNWRLSITAQQQASLFPDDLRLGQWLNTNSRLTLIDHRAAYAIISAKGNAGNLLLPHMPEFKISLKKGQPDTPQLVVMNPANRYAYKDSISLRYPELYRDGMQGYQLVFDSPTWRAYRKVEH